MKIQSIIVIHNLVCERLAEITPNREVAEQKARKALWDFKKAEGNPNIDKTSLSLAKTLMEKTRDEAQELNRKERELRKALTDFESHDWH